MLPHFHLIGIARLFEKINKMMYTAGASLFNSSEGNLAEVAAQSRLPRGHHLMSASCHHESNLADSH